MKPPPCSICKRRPRKDGTRYCGLCAKRRIQQHLDRLASKPPPLNYALLENAPGPTLTVEQANKRAPWEMPTVRDRARPRAHARFNHRPGSRGSMSGD